MRRGRSSNSSDSSQFWTRRLALKACVATTVMPLGFRSAGANDPVYDPVFPDKPAPPRSEFDARSTGEQVTAGLALQGKTAIVTGCNSGIGFETMRVLAARGIHVFGTARTAEKAETACDEVGGKTTPLVMELTDFASIISAAESVREMVDSLDILILNAGVMALPQLQQVNGIERQFVVNHLGHFLLTQRVMDLIVAAPQGRVVVVSSSAHVWAPQRGIEFDNLSGESRYEPFAAYGQSKLANGLFSRELARRLGDTNATSNSLHPGVISTNISRHLPGGSSNASSVSSRMKTIAEGAATSCYLATHPSLSGVSGYYFADCNQAYPNAHMQNDAMAAKLWSVSDELVATF